jgi:hypothetical protein
VFAIASVLVFPHLFFPFEDRLTGTLYAFSLRAGFRGPTGRNTDRHVDSAAFRPFYKLTVALLLLGCSTVSMAMLPTYQSWAAPRSGCWCCAASGKAWHWAAPGTACPRCWP